MAKPKSAHPGNMAIDDQGHVLPYGPEQVRAIVQKALNDPTSEILAIVLRVKDDLMVQVMGPPSRELLNILEMTARSYRNALRDH
jgi:hypothetical protein